MTPRAPLEVGSPIESCCHDTQSPGAILLAPLQPLLYPEGDRGLRPWSGESSRRSTQEWHPLLFARHITMLSQK